MIRFCNPQGHVLVDIPDGHALHLHISRELDKVRVGDVVLVDQTPLEVVGRSHAFHAGHVSIGRHTQEWSSERTVITVSPINTRRARKLGSRHSLSITTRSAR